MPRELFSLRITLSDVTPSVWRRVVVPAGYTLDRLHRVIQHAMGWHDSHLHSFDIGGESYGVPDPEGELALRDELDFRLDAVTGKGGQFTYTYDFGDWWDHDILVEDVLLADPEQRYPICLDGQRACPPESVGGPAGYQEFRTAMLDPRHPQHAQMREWHGRAFDPDAFDPSRTTTLLRRFS